MEKANNYFCCRCVRVVVVICSLIPLISLWLVLFAGLPEGNSLTRTEILWILVIFQVDKVLAVTSVTEKGTIRLLYFLVNIVLMLCHLVFLWATRFVGLPAEHSLTLYWILWTYVGAHGDFTLALTLWVRTRYSYNTFSTKHRSHGPDSSSSGLLLLPPEIRLRIWDDLLQRCCWAPCINIVSEASLDIPEDTLCRVLGLPLGNQTRTYTSGLPVALLRTCRQMYEEGSHFLYSTRTFSFSQPRAFCDFVNSRSLAQKRSIRHIELVVGSWFLRDEPIRSHELVREWLCNHTLHPSQLASITEKLPNLRTIDIYTERCNPGLDVGYHAQSMLQFLSHVRASKTVTLRLEIFLPPICHNVGPKVQWEWGPQCQKDFATAVWQLTLDPKSHASVAANAEQVLQKKYILVHILDEDSDEED